MTKQVIVQAYYSMLETKGIKVNRSQKWLEADYRVAEEIASKYPDNQILEGMNIYISTTFFNQSCKNKEVKKSYSTDDVFLSSVFQFLKDKYGSYANSNSSATKRVQWVAKGPPKESDKEPDKGDSFGIKYYSDDHQAIPVLFYEAKRDRYLDFYGQTISKDYIQRLGDSVVKCLNEETVIKKTWKPGLTLMVDMREI